MSRYGMMKVLRRGKYAPSKWNQMAEEFDQETMTNTDFNRTLFAPAGTLNIANNGYLPRTSSASNTIQSRDESEASMPSRGFSQSTSTSSIKHVSFKDGYARQSRGVPTRVAGLASAESC
mmetsp:Transcript_13349/g.28972  ORF Transcript_13349/g.28972 Transcript_13349/m.28972 type:complete len:120 (+) Transcript_13349:113-472(+)|eukprot:CAMPEP_0185845784 /NCGR_PEP_ID=MMETSP1354-20130828/1658_1 /TAXON_ID=708628 /ORGANISM="Erythrolobus madagascarensis, Strain CCMP3276" /LENGTH=119 /DNA_ID=CAMNT_0028545833 /DNA_START=77 /DNA_END=436 /DNA_ORIENTATION=-